MWVEELPNGKFKYFERYKDPYTEKLKKVSVTMEKKTPQARNQAAILLQEKINKKLSTKQVESITFEEIYNLFYKSWAQTVKESTKHNCKSVDKTMKQVIPSDTLLANLDRRFLQQAIEKVIESNGYITAKKVRHRLRGIFKYAVQYSYIDNNEVDYTTIPQKPKTLEELEKKRNNFLTMQEIKALVDVLNRREYHQKYADMVLVLALTGMRYGELTALQLKNIDFENNKIEISGNFDSVNKIKTLPKTTNSIRTIKVSKTVMEAIQRQIVRLSERFQPLSSDDYIFCFERWNQPTTISCFIQILKKYGKQAKIEKNLSSHIFRHSHISFLAESGLPIKSIMDRVGHSNAKMTLEIYSHTTEDMEDKLVNKLDTIF
ncbi:site-specific recombinase, phage integrase family [Streptococcus sp. CM6]|uniref:tyrosine-type recombinase/integrase n=1 Tax=Streptococcus sp. CM6 TaxID=936580 RepID=UPI00044C8016|nr:site-specific integrase [Streptococcus sp. CM6]EUC81422.1 site-specific recombinase, phage integrase family [Streptococcus sp. CM6]